MSTAWLSLIRWNEGKTKTQEELVSPTPYLITGGAEIHARLSQAAAPITFEAGAKIALAGAALSKKHYFCDWLLGFVELPKGQIEIQVGETRIVDAGERALTGAVIGRSPMLCGETLQESLLYRTHHVRKPELLHFVNRLFGPALRKRANPANPLFDHENKPIATGSLTAREHMEVAQINALLQKTPIVILDLSSELMAEALLEGYRPCRELFESGKTMLFVLPQDKDTAWAESILGTKFTSSLQFN